MDPSGPDFCVPVSMDTVVDTNKAIADEFLSLTENLCSRDQRRTSSHIKHLRKSQKANVLYITESKSRVDMGDAADMFYIPVGAPRDEVECPWKKTDVTSGGM
jgi:hypothetical protein